MHEENENAYIREGAKEEGYTRHFPRRKTPVRDPRCGKVVSMCMGALVLTAGLRTRAVWRA